MVTSYGQESSWGGICLPSTVCVRNTMLVLFFVSSWWWIWRLLTSKMNSMQVIRRRGGLQIPRIKVLKHEDVHCASLVKSAASKLLNSSAEELFWDGLRFSCYLVFVWVLVHTFCAVFWYMQLEFALFWYIPVFLLSQADFVVPSYGKKANNLTKPQWRCQCDRVYAQSCSRLCLSMSSYAEHT